MELQGKRAAVLVEQMYQEMEVWYPIYRLREAGCKVTVVGPEAGQTYPSKLGYPVKNDKAARDVSAEDFDILIIPGGYAPDHMRRCEPMIRLVSTMAEQGKVVAAICHGPWMLCSTQALKGRKATCFFAIKDDVVNAGEEARRLASLEGLRRAQHPGTVADGGHDLALLGHRADQADHRFAAAHV